LAWLADQLREWHHVIAAWPDDLLLRYPDAPDLHVVHGRPGNPWRGIYAAPHHDDATVAEWLDAGRAPTLIAAHTHLALDRWVGQRRVINPGSVGVPLDGQPTAAYMILDGDADGWQVTAARRVPFDVAAAVDGLRRSGFIDAGGPIAELALEEVQQHVIRVHAFLNWHWDAHPDEPQTRAHLDAFRQLDPRPHTMAPYRPFIPAPEA
jgi:diadenosine tetraphosphatase ApaH/serine/threonine PP2A family protein phosphatase